MLLDVAYTDKLSERYQVLVRWDTGPIDEYADIATIGADEDRTAYDALYNPADAKYFLSLVDSSATVGDVRFGKEPDATLPMDAAPRVSSAEQSNTSVIFEEQAVFKVFRRITPGINPDIELNRVLARADNPHVARLLGSYETKLDDEPYALGMVTEFAANLRRGLGHGHRQHARPVRRGRPVRRRGGRRLRGRVLPPRRGGSLGARHLAEELGTSTTWFPTDAVLERLASAAASVPDLEQYVPLIEERYRKLTEETITVQRVHGDLHLGQVLRTPERWLLIDFEGEPGQPLDERRRPDSTARDVAGVLRARSSTPPING